MIDYDTFIGLVQTSIASLQDSIPLVSDQLRLLPAVYSAMSVYDGAAAALLRQSLLATLATTIAQTTFQSRTEAEQALSRLVPLYDAEIARTDELTAWQALRTLKAALIDDLTTRGLQLPELVTVTYRTTLPSFVIAHDLYLDASRADEIVLRNDPVHPLFCQATLEVLSA